MSRVIKLGTVRVKRLLDCGDIDTSILCCWKTVGGVWQLYIPGCGVGDLRNHEVTENVDGTITVTQSILCEGHQKGERTQVHGYIKNCEWSDV